MKAYPEVACACRGCDRVIMLNESVVINGLPYCHVCKYAGCSKAVAVELKEAS